MKLEKSSTDQNGPLVLDTQTALCRAISIYARKHGEIIGRSAKSVYYQVRLPVGDDDKYYPYVVALRENNVLEVTVQETRVASSDDTRVMEQQ